MRLIRLSDAGVFRNKKIVCIERSEAYLSGFCDRYQALDNITAIMDDNLRNVGTMRLREREIPVYYLGDLRQLDLSDSVFVITSDYFREYFMKLQKLLEEGGDVEDIYFFASKETEYDLYYREKYKAVPLENIIVFRSGPHADEYVQGMDFTDNARALFEYALSIHLNRKYVLVWIVKSPDDFKVYEEYENVFFLPFAGSVSDDEAVRERYYRVLCLARYFFFTDAYGFARNCREDQVRVQLWHGCGFKKRLNGASCRHRYEYMTVTSKLYAKLHAGEFGLRDNQMLVTGCAKEDWLFQDAGDIFHKLNIPTAGKYIFWLPTYRFSEAGRGKPIDGRLCEETGLPLVSDLRELELINSALAKSKMVLVIKLHPFQDRQAVHIGDFSNIVLLENEVMARNDIQVNQLLAKADALISDYSSSAIDYLVLDRPMAFLTEDLEDYSGDRGFIFENVLDWLPGKQVCDIKGFLSFIEEIGEGCDSAKERRLALRTRMHQYGDKNNCKRILEALGILQE